MRLPASPAWSATRTSAISRTCQAHRDGPQDLVLEHGGGEGRRGQVRHAARDGIGDRLAQPFGQVVVGEAQHDTHVFAERARVQRGLQVHDVRAGHRDQRDARVQAGPAQGLLAERVADHHRETELAGQGDAGGVGLVVDADHVEAQVVELAGDAGADVAEPDDDDVTAGGPRCAADGAGQPGADDEGGHHRDEGQAVEGEQHLRDLLDPAVEWCSVSADPVRSISVRYTALVKE